MSASEQLNRYRKSVEEGMRPDEAVRLRELERRIKTLESYEKFANMPAIKDLRSWATREIVSINQRLSTDAVLLHDGHEGERLAMLNRKDVLLYFLGLLDPIAELEEIERSLSTDATVFENYQENRGFNQPPILP